MNLSETPEKFQEEVNKIIKYRNNLFGAEGNLFHIEINTHSALLTFYKAYVEYPGSFLIISHFGDKFEEEIISLSDVFVIMQKSPWGKIKDFYR